MVIENIFGKKPPNPLSLHGNTQIFLSFRFFQRFEFWCAPKTHTTDIVFVYTFNSLLTRYFILTRRMVVPQKSACLHVLSAYQVQRSIFLKKRFDKGLGNYIFFLLSLEPSTRVTKDNGERDSRVDFNQKFSIDVI